MVLEEIHENQSFFRILIYFLPLSLYKSLCRFFSDRVLKARGLKLSVTVREMGYSARISIFVFHL